MSIAGIWQNEYGSRMSLTVRGSVVEGVYASTTGSTGEFCVTGWACENTATTEAGQPVALSVKWHSLVDGEADASWNWASAMGGQVNIVDGREAMVLSHFMIASRSFEGLCKHGVYIDKLTFYRISDVPKPVENLSFIKAKANDPISGSWTTSDGGWGASRTGDGNSAMFCGFHVEVLRAKDGSKETYAFVSGLKAYTNDVIRVVTGNGGGFGDPKERDQSLVAQDIRNGVLSVERARSVYGYQG